MRVTPKKTSIVTIWMDQEEDLVEEGPIRASLSTMVTRLARAVMTDHLTNQVKVVREVQAMISRLGGKEISIMMIHMISEMQQL